MDAVTKTDHPHIERRPGVCGGSAVIHGTRIPVRLIAGFVRDGIPVDEILQGYPDLTPAQVYDALSYYHDHRAEVDLELEESTLEFVQQRYGLRLNERGFLVPRS